MTTPADVAARLGSLELFASLPPDRLRQLAQDIRVRRYRDRQVVFSTEDPGDALVVVNTGRLKLAVRSADGAELTLTTVERGSVIGELGVIDGGQRSTDAVTLEPTELLFIPREVVHNLMSQFPSVSIVLLSTVAASLRRLTETTADLVFLDLPRRVAKLLLAHAPDTESSGGIALSQEELAHRVGATRQSVNSALRGFERRGWIEIGHRHIRLRDQAALSRFAGD